MEKVYRAEQASDDNLIRRMHLACRIKKAADTPSECVIIIAFPDNNGYANAPQNYTSMYIVSLVHFWVILISGCCRNVNEIFALLGCFAALISSSCRHFGTNYRVLLFKYQRAAGPI